MRGLGKKTKCGIAASQLATKGSAKQTKVKAAKKLATKGKKGCK